MIIRQHVQHVKDAKKWNPTPISESLIFKFATFPRDRKWHISKLTNLPRAPYQPHAKNNGLVICVLCFVFVTGKFATCLPLFHCPLDVKWRRLVLSNGLGRNHCCANTNTKFPRQCLGSTPKGFAHSIPIRCRCIYCIHQHGGGSNIIWPIPWTLSCLKFSSIILEVKFRKCWCLCQPGSVSLGVGNFRLHLSQCIRLWEPDILGSNICMFHPTSDDDGKFVAASICCKNETCVSMFKYCWRIRTSRWGTLMPWSCYFSPGTSEGRVWPVPK